MKDDVKVNGTKPSPVVGLMVTRPQLERLAFQVNAGLAFGSTLERQEALGMGCIVQNDDEGIDFRWNPEFVATCTDTNLADFVMASVSSNEMISEEEIVAEAMHATKH